MSVSPRDNRRAGADNCPRTNSGADIEATHGTSALASIEAMCTEYPLPYARPRAFLYFLIVGDRVVYIGQTNNIESRLISHWGQGNTFERALVREVPHERASEYEGALIRALLPVLNLRCPVYRGGDNAVRAEFGLPLAADEEADASRAMQALRDRGRHVPRTRRRTGMTREMAKRNNKRNAKILGRSALYQAVLLLAAGRPVRP